jgi:hypothetical protein
MFGQVSTAGSHHNRSRRHCQIVGTVSFAYAARKEMLWIDTVLCSSATAASNECHVDLRAQFGSSFHLGGKEWKCILEQAIQLLRILAASFGALAALPRLIARGNLTANTHVTFTFGQEVLGSFCEVFFTSKGIYSDIHKKNHPPSQMVFLMQLRSVKS